MLWVYYLPFCFLLVVVVIVGSGCVPVAVLWLLPLPWACMDSRRSVIGRLYCRRRNVCCCFPAVKTCHHRNPFYKWHEFELTRAAVVCEEAKCKLFTATFQACKGSLSDTQRIDFWWTITLKHYMNILHVIRPSTLWVILGSSAQRKDFLMILDCKETKSTSAISFTAVPTLWNAFRIPLTTSFWLNNNLHLSDVPHLSW